MVVGRLRKRKETSVGAVRGKRSHQRADLPHGSVSTASCSPAKGLIVATLRSQQIVSRCHVAFNLVTKLAGKRGFYCQLFHPPLLVALTRIILRASSELRIGNAINALVLRDLVPFTCHRSMRLATFRTIRFCKHSFLCG